MKVFEQERAIRERAIREGHQIGLEEGREEGGECLRLYLGGIG